jgi:hypothetical protein
VRARLIVGLSVVCVALSLAGWALVGPASRAGASSTVRSDRFHRSIWRQAQSLIAHDHITVPWDGRFSYNEKTEICIEVFNGTRRDLTWHHQVPSGFYLKICADGERVVHDATPFPHMQTY